MRTLLLAALLLPSSALAAGEISECAPEVASPLRAFDPLRALNPNAGRECLSSKADFDSLARRGNVPGAMNVKEVKILITGIYTGSPKLNFINTNEFGYHYDFYTRGLGNSISLERFNAETYFTDRRKNLAGTIVFHENARGGAYTLEFWPTDPVKASLVAKAYALVSRCMRFADGSLLYHPSGETQRSLYEAEKAAFDRAGIPVIFTEDLLGDVTYTALNEGEAFGVLRIANATDTLTARDIVIFKSIPNDLSKVSGVITELPQTPLSHVNLKAKQDDIPNAYLKDAANDPRLKDLVGKVVYYKAGPDGIEIREATPEEADRFFESKRPSEPQVAKRNLRVRTIKPLSRIGNENADAFGAKAANVGELNRILDSNVPDGYAIPFSFYDKFMRANGLYDAAKTMMADPRFQKDPAFREKALDDFRKKLKKAPVPAELAQAIAAAHAKFPEGQPIRARSSTNNEDLEGFTGAGLYDSYTHRPDEGALEKTVKQVWASTWNFRAYEEREFYRIDHTSAAMAVLLHPNTDDEASNGVAVTKNIYDPNWPGYYVNVQKGENLVTNPEPGTTPDEYLVAALGEHGEFETQYIKHSNQVPAGTTVLTESQRAELKTAMDEIQTHFAKVYGREGDETFGMDIEFKFDSAGKLIVKQARPWVD